MKKKSSTLISSTELVIKILSIGVSMKSDQVAVLRASFTRQLNSDVLDEVSCSQLDICINVLLIRDGKKGRKWL